MKLGRRNKSRDWTMLDLNKVLKSLKKNKARDPMRWPNELFCLENIGKDLKCSALKLMNCIKTAQYLPKMLRSPDITSVFKKQGSKFYLNNERCIFKLNVLRTILDKLIYMDKIDGIDASISDTQIGVRKKKNIRNHLFMIYGIQNEVKQAKNKSIDIMFYDIEKMFDSQWTTDTLNDIYEACDVKDDKVSLMHESNKEAHYCSKVRRCGTSAYMFF